MTKRLFSTCVLVAFAIACLLSMSGIASATIIHKSKEYTNSWGEKVEEWLYPANVVQRKTYRGDGMGLLKIEFLRPDGTVRTYRFENDGETFASDYQRDKDGNYLDETYYQKNKINNKRIWREDKGLNITAYQADGTTLKLEQSWRYELSGKGKNGRTTPYLLEWAKEYDGTGKLVREVLFHPDGKSLAKSTSYNADGSLTVTHVDDAGFIIATDTTNSHGIKTSIRAEKGSQKWQGADFRALVIDPWFGGNEPGKSINLRKFQG